MIKRGKTGCKRLLCWLLTAAMVMTGSSVPGLETKAASTSDLVTQTVEREEQSENTESKENVSEAVSEEASSEESRAEETSSEENSDEDASKEDEREESSTEDDTSQESSAEDTSEQESETEESSEDESLEKETEDSKDAVELLDDGEEEYGTLVNGDFEDENWSLAPWTLTAEGADTKKIEVDEADTTNHYLNIWTQEGTDISLIQTVSNVKGGNYKASLKLQGDSGLTVDFKIKSDDKELTESVNLGDYSAWNGWKDVSTAKFEITEGANVTVEISGSLSQGQTIKIDDIELVLQPDTYTKAELETLYNKYKDYKESDYTDDSWSAFASALTTVSNILSDEGKTDADNSDEITAAYEALEKAAEELEMLSINATLYYYVGDTTDEVGVVAWSGGIISYGNTAVKADWTPWNGTDCYLMTKSEYAGWYSIDLVFEDAETSSGFEIFTASKNDDNTYTPGSASIYKCAKADYASDVYAKLVSGEVAACAVKNGKLYTDIITIQRNITLYVYDTDGTPAIMSSAQISAVDETTGSIGELDTNYTDSYGNRYYDMLPDETASNWYYLTFSVPTVDTGAKVFQLYRKTATNTYDWVKNFINGGTSDEWNVDITPVFSGNIYYKDGAFTDTKGKTAALEELIAEAETYKESDYTSASWAVFAEALEEAKKVVALDEPTDEQITSATEALEKAMKELKPSRQADINVEKVALPDDFITGADLSSYISLVESGVVFKDANGNALSDAEFFKAIKDGGTNWVRIRIWDNPYDSSGNSYGGGHNDLETAIKIGKLATNAGMRVLIDFHYSDFWVDPAKYKAPKAWADMTVAQKADAIYNHTYNNLTALKKAGVDVGMVQVGNETNNGIAGVSYSNKADICSLFSAGSRAVRAFSKEAYDDEKAVKVAVHFADPQDGFSKFAEIFNEYEVDYDVFAASYYPYWHENATAEGDTTSLTTALEYVATTYGKQVMVAETSWATSWDDGDGHENSSPKITDNLQYDISVQGQADEMRAVVAAVNSVTNGIGVFYWEPAWIPVGYAYNDDGTVNQEQLKKNQALWEKYGSGWASSYSKEYDPEDAGRWYGGSAIDNQAWFDFDGTALPTLNAYSYIRTGASCDTIKISYVPKNKELEVSVGDPITYPDTITAKFNNGTTREFPVEWDENQMKLVSTDKTGEYTIDGVVTCKYNNNLKDVVEKYNVTLTIKVVAKEGSNQLINPGFENGSNGWTITYRMKTTDANGNVTETESTTVPEGADYDVSPKDKINGTPHSENYGMNFWRGDDGIAIKISQKITDLEAGTYSFGGFIQGGSAGEGDVSYAYVKITPVDGNGEQLEEQSYTLKSKCELKGWNNWSQPEISGFTISKGDIIEVGFEINTSVADSWGSIDDLYLYGSYGVTVDPELKNGSITVSDTVATVGEKIHFIVTPNDGYVVDDKDIYLYTTAITVDGVEQKNRVNGCEFEVTDGKGSFIMPSYPISITADIKQVKDIDLATQVSFDEIATQIYTGKAITPEITAVYKTYTLVQGRDYTVKYSDNIALTTVTAKAKVTVTGKGNFTGTKELTFDIKEGINLKNATVTISESDFVDKKEVPNFYYTGNKIMPQVTVKITVDGREKTLTEGDDFVLAYENNVKVGTARLHIVANEKNAIYTGSVTKTFKIVKADLQQLLAQNKVTVSTASGSTYTGKAVKPNITIKYGMYTLQKGKDYTVTYKNNINVARDDDNNTVKAAEMIIKGKGNFAGELSTKTLTDENVEKIKFKISPQYLSSDKVEAKAKTLLYTGKKLSPSITVTSEVSGGLRLGRDYTISAYRFVPSETGKATISAPVENNKVPMVDKGTYTLTLQGTGNYSGTKTVGVRVTDKEFDIANARIEVKAADFTGNKVELVPYDSSSSAPYGIKVYFTGKNAKVLSPEDYELKYENNINAGSTAKVTVIGTGEYAGEKTVSFKINKADISKLLFDKKAQEASKGSANPVTANVGLAMTDNQETVLYYTGYALQPAFSIKPTLKNGKDYQKSSSKVVSLVAGKDYTISFSNNVTGKKQSDGTYLATAKIQGKGNYTGTYTTTFPIIPTSLDDFVIKVDNVVYTGGSLKPSITFTHKETGKDFDLKVGTAYTVSYKNNKNVANENSAKVPTVIIKAKGLGYHKTVKSSPVTKTFCITNAKIDAASVADIKVQSYKNGKAVKPSLTVKVNGRTLRLNKDYKVTYSDNRLRGQATVTITGIGNYSGTVTKSFTIK